MAALATFDTDGHWLSLSVCEGAACPLADALGVRWGRWHDGATEPDEDNDGHNGEALAALRQTLGPHVAERVRLNGGQPVPPGELIGEDTIACVFLQGTALLLVRTPAGFTGLLCEAGDWVLLPAGLPHVFDAGAAPEVEFLRLCAGKRGWFPLRGGTRLPESLPRLDAFVRHLLHELGEEIDGG